MGVIYSRALPLFFGTRFKIHKILALNSLSLAPATLSCWQLAGRGNWSQYNLTSVNLPCFLNNRLGLTNKEES